MSGYITYENETVTKQLIDSIEVGDLVKINDWKKPLRVKGVSKNYFVMAAKQFGHTIYSVCEKPWGGVMRNAMTGGMFHCGRDSWIFGWQGWDGKYDFDDTAKTAEYLKSFENPDSEYHSELSPRSAVPIWQIHVKKSDKIERKKKGKDNEPRRNNIVPYNRHCQSIYRAHQRGAHGWAYGFIPICQGH